MKVCVGDFTTDSQGNAKTEGHQSSPFELINPSQKNRGGFPPLFMLTVSIDSYESAIAAIETDSAANQASAAWKWASDLSVLTSEP
jgi:hypothetical protein